MRSRRSAGRGTKSEKSEMEYDDTTISCGIVVREVGWWCGCFEVIHSEIGEIERVVGEGMEADGTVLGYDDDTARNCGVVVIAVE